jgi:2-methylcitrate dehydratase
VLVQYPIGHKRRRAEGLPLLHTKFRTHLSHRFAARQQQAILAASADRKALEAMPVHEYVDLYAVGC